MSFVIDKAIKHTIFEVPQTQQPGPGQYDFARQITVDCAAPFNSSTYKHSSFDVAVVQYGPGSYDPVYSKAVLSKKKLSVTSPFVSKVERFKTEQNEERGQQNQYENQFPKTRQRKANSRGKTNDILKRLQQENNKRKVQSIKLTKDYVRILLTNPKNTELVQSVYADRSIVGKLNGPGSCDIPCKSKQKGNLDWSKSKQRRFKSHKNDVPGPGHYDLEEPYAKDLRMSASFCCVNTRHSIFEEINKIKLPFKTRGIGRSTSPGPGDYNPQSALSHSFHQGIEHFGSHVEEEKPARLNQEEISGPGLYNVFEGKRKSMKNIVKQTRERIFGKSKQRYQTSTDQTLEKNNRKEVIKSCVERMSERIKFYTLKERCSSKVGTLSQSNRFQKPKITTEPGPGQYTSKTVLTQKKPNQVFQSVTVRDTFLPTTDNDIPFYEINRNDIGKKVAKIKKNLQNLKKINIVKAPFNTSSKRMGYQSPTKNVQSESLMSNSPTQETMIPALPIKESPAFKSTTKRQFYVKQTQIGPGAYLPTTNSLEKKSFNLQYNYRKGISRNKKSLRVHSSLN